MFPKKEPVINVGILSEKKINFELYGDFSAFGFQHTFSGVYTAEVINNVIVCKGTSSKIEITDEIIFEPSDPVSESFLIRDVTIGIDFHWERKEKERFIYSLKLLRNGNDIIVINILPLETYLVSVISSEMSAKGSLQFLKALAVISRSWALAQLEKSGSDKRKTKENSTYDTMLEHTIWYGREQHTFFDVCADDHCQRFQGVSKITTESARTAVRQTHGVVILSENKICDTRYSKSCGGVTEDFENVWEPVKNPCLTSRVDYKYKSEIYDIDFSNEGNARKWIVGNPPAFCNTYDKKILSQILIDFDRETKDFYRWEIEYLQDELASIIRDKTKIDFGDILDLEPLERGSSSRLIKLKIVGTRKTLIIGKELEIRRVLSRTHLYSSAIVIDKVYGEKKVPNKFIIHGAGWGHGVGLCQIGAAVMAEKGYQFDEILLHYFSNAAIKKIY